MVFQVTQPYGVCSQCLMPESTVPRLEEVSEEALKERISLRKVSAAVEMYDQLLQSGEFTRRKVMFQKISPDPLHQLWD